MTPENLGVDTKFFAMSQPEEKILAFFLKKRHLGGGHIGYKNQWDDVLPSDRF